MGVAFGVDCLVCDSSCSLIVSCNLWLSLLIVLSNVTVHMESGVGKIQLPGVADPAKKPYMEVGVRGAFVVLAVVATCLCAYWYL